MSGTLVHIKILKSWVPLGTGDGENFRSRVQMDTGYQQEKSFGYRWVPGTNQKKIFGYRWVRPENSMGAYGKT